MLDAGISPDAVNYMCVLKACRAVRSLEMGEDIDTEVRKRGLLQSNIALGSELVDMYAKCKSLEDACNVFDEMPTNDVVVWNAMISGYASHGYCCQALELLHSMQIQGPQPNHRSWTAILSGYAHYGHDKDASQLIQQMSYEGLEPNIVTWNALISGYVLHGHNEEAIQVFSQMFGGNHWPDKVTYLSLVKACASKVDLQLGKLIHNQMINDDIDIGVAIVTSLIDMYAKCGSLENAWCLFEKLSKKDVVAWNTIISGYVLHGCGMDAFCKFQQMQAEGIMPDITTLLSILKMCSLTSALNIGMIIHSSMIDSGLDVDEYAASSLIDMYAGSGSLKDAHKVFDKMPKVDLASWNALVAGYAISSDYPPVDKLLEDMQSKGLAPDGVTFVSLLSSCGFLGLVDEGSKLFNSMRETYGVSHTNEHFGCMVDLLGGSGFLLEAEDFLHVAPHQPTIVPWTSLLNSCRVFNDVDIAEHCFEHVVDMDESCASAYALMSIIYSTSGMGDDSCILKEMRQHSNAWKKLLRFLSWVKKHRKQAPRCVTM